MNQKINNFLNKELNKLQIVASFSVAVALAGILLVGGGDFSSNNTNENNFLSDSTQKAEVGTLAQSVSGSCAGLVKPTASGTGANSAAGNSSRGSITITTDNYVLENTTVNGKILIKGADNVVIRNVKINGGGIGYPLDIRGGSANFLVENVTVLDGSSTNIFVLEGASGTVRKSHIDVSTGDAIKVDSYGPGILFEGNYIGPHMGSADGAHADGMQAEGGGTNYTFRGNTFFQPSEHSARSVGAPYKSNANFLVTKTSNLIIECNWLNGGNYSIYNDTNNVGMQIVNNKFGPDMNKFNKTTQHEPLQNGGSQFKICGNIWEETVDSSRTAGSLIAQNNSTNCPSIQTPTDPVNPVADAGQDKTIKTNTLTLAGSAYDDNNNLASTRWSVVSGSGVTFANVNTLNTTATFPGVGTYTLRLTATDSTVPALTGTDDVTITVVGIPTVPGKIEAESFDDFYDTTGSVGVEPTTDVGGGSNVGYMAAGEWLSYNVNATQSGTYTFTARVANQGSSALNFSVHVDGVSTGSVSVPTTGGWQTFVDVSKSITLSAGAHTIKLAFDQAPFNINWFSLTTGTTIPTYALTTSVVGSGSINGNTSPYDNGETAALTAVPAAGSTFTGWTGACSGTSTTCTITMNANKSATATFTTVQGNILTANTAGTGSGSISGNTSPYDADEVATVTANAASGSTFTSWSGCSTASGNVCVVTMNTAKTVTATFTKNPTPPGSNEMLLKVNTENPRYFQNANGDTVYLTGHHSWSNMSARVSSFNFDTYLNEYKSQGLNFIARLWRQENDVQLTSGTPFPYNKVNGQWILKDSNGNWTFNQAYFDEMRSRVNKAKLAGIYVNIMMFEGWWVEGGEISWAQSVFNGNNNNGWSGSAVGMADMHTLNKSVYVDAQKAYVAKVLETLKDYDNVMYEIGNEMNHNSAAFNTEMISYIKNWENNSSNNSLKHLVGATSSGGGASATGGVSNSYLLGTSHNADWIALGQREGLNLVTNPGVYNPNSSKPRPNFSDTDHSVYDLKSTTWPWMTFMRGHQAIVMDPWTDFGGTSAMEPTRRALAQTLKIANKIDLAGMSPSNSTTDCSTGYCLRNTIDGEYVAYNSGTGTIGVKIAQAGTYTYSVYTAGNIDTAPTSGTFTATSNQTWTTPVGKSGGSVVHIKKSSGPSIPTYILTTSVVGSGSINGNTSPYDAGEVATLTAVPAAGSTFTGWTGACSGTSTTCVITMNANKSATATFTTVPEPTYILTTSVVGSGSIGGNTSPYDAGEVATLTAIPANNYVLARWTGCSTASGNICVLTMNSNKTVTAEFRLDEQGYSLTTNTTGTGVGEVTKNPNQTSYFPNTPVTLTAIPASGSLFTGWSGACSGTNTTCTITMNANKSATARFEEDEGPSDPLVLTTNTTGTGSGTIEGNNSPYVAGAVVTLVAKPATGSTFTGWTGACSGTSTTCVITMNANKSATATFTKDPGTGATQDKVLSISGSKSIEIGKTYTIEVTYDAKEARYMTFELKSSSRTIHASEVKLVPAGVRQVATFNLTVPSDTPTDKSLEYMLYMSSAGTWNTRLSYDRFTGVSATGGVVVKYTLAANTAGTGSGSISGNTSPYVAGTVATVTANAAAGSTFTGWTGCSTASGNVCVVTMDTNKTVTATFTKDVALDKPLITSPANGAVFNSSTKYVTITWEGDASNYLLRATDLTDPSQNTSKYGTYGYYDTYKTKSVTLPVVRGHEYRFWAHFGTLSNYSEESFIKFSVAN